MLLGARLGIFFEGGACSACLVEVDGAASSEAGRSCRPRLTARVRALQFRNGQGSARLAENRTDALLPVPTRETAVGTIGLRGRRLPAALSSEGRFALRRTCISSRERWPRRAWGPLSLAWRAII